MHIFSTPLSIGGLAEWELEYRQPLLGVTMEDQIHRLVGKAWGI